MDKNPGDQELSKVCNILQSYSGFANNNEENNQNNHLEGKTDSLQLYVIKVSLI